MGKRMFDLGEHAWPEEAPFHTPVFVVTHEKRDSWERPGGTTLFEGVDAGRVALEPVRAEPTQRVTHLTYAVRER
jgi:dihydrofolate reductase